MSMQDSSNRTGQVILFVWPNLEECSKDGSQPKFALRKKSIAATPWQKFELSIAEVQLEGHKKRAILLMQDVAPAKQMSASLSITCLLAQARST